MFDPFGNDADEEKPPRPPFPSPTTALMLTFGASLAAFVIAIVLFEEPDVAALGIGEALGVGGVASLAARRVPDPQPERLGLRGFSPRFLPMLLCLIPLVFVASELDNWARDLDAHFPSWVPAEALTLTEPGSEEDSASVEAELTAEEAAAATAFTEEANEFGPGDETTADKSPAELPTGLPEGWALIQIAIVSVGIAPVVEGFLFFGVILQGLVSVLGRNRGLLLTGCLYAMIHVVGQVGVDAGPARSLAGLVAMVVMGTTLGLCRLATGSVLAPILVATGFIGVQLFALVAPEVFAVPGYNVDLDAHTPLSILLPAMAASGWGLWMIANHRGPELPPIVMPPQARS